MPDENPSSDASSSFDSTPKKETVRITLPPKPSDTPTVKRETVRINVPGKPAGDATTPPPAPSGPKPFVPPAPAPRPAGIAPSAPPPPPASRPLGGIGAPKPPGPPPRPTVPLKGPPPPAPAGGVPDSALKAAQPKKETARIQIPPEPKPIMPKATVRMQQTQPLSQMPAATIQTVAPNTAAAGGAAEEPLVGILSWVAVFVSLISLVLAYLAFSSVQI